MAAFVTCPYCTKTIGTVDDGDYEQRLHLIEVHTVEKCDCPAVQAMSRTTEELLDTGNASDVFWNAADPYAAKWPDLDEEEFVEVFDQLRVLGIMLYARSLNSQRGKPGPSDPDTRRQEDYT